MSLDRILPFAAVAAALSFFSATPVPVGSAEPARVRSEPSKAPCCFKNPAYAGTCNVQPVEDETCGSILAYLNNPMAQGKSYCGGTTVRQGWTEVSCKEKTGDYAGGCSSERSSRYRRGP